MTNIYWITNPFDPLITNKHEWLLSTFKDLNVTILTENKFNMGIIAVFAKNVKFNNLEQENLVYNYIYDITYVPLVINATFSKSEIDKIDENKQSIYIRGIVSILANVVNTQFNLSYDLNTELSRYITYQKIDDQINDFYIYQFTFVDNLENMIYVDPLRLSNLYTNININSKWGYNTIGNDPLLHYVIHNSPYHDQIIYDELGLFLLKADLSTIIDVDTLEVDLYSLKRGNHFAITNLYDKKRNLIKEISLLWNINEVYYSPDWMVGIYKVDEVEFWPSSSIWLDRAYQDIEDNLVPKFRWRSKYTADLDYDDESRARLMYVLLRSYADLNEPDLAIYITDLYVYPDLTMEVRLVNYEQFKVLNKLVDDWLKSGIHRTWFIKYVNNVEELLVNRYYYIQKNSESLPLGVEFDDKIFLIYDKPLYDGSVDNISAKQYSIIKSAIEDIFRIYYNLPDDNLNEMLNVIKLPSGTYDINQIKLPVDPETMKPLTEEQLYDLSNHTYALYGYYPLLIDIVPELNKSLLKYVPKRIMIPLDFGELLIGTFEQTCITSYDIQFNMGSEYYYYKLLKTNGDYNIDEIAPLVHSVWKCGYFLSAWGTAYYNLTKMFSRSAIYIYPYIKESIASPQDTKVALTYLNLIDNNRCGKNRLIGDK